LIWATLVNTHTRTHIHRKTAFILLPQPAELKTTTVYRGACCSAYVCAFRV